MIRMMDLDVLDHAENIRYLEVLKMLHRTDGLEVIRKLAQVLEVKDTYHHGIEFRVQSLKNDGSQSWIVIIRCMNKYVDELR